MHITLRPVKASTLIGSLLLAIVGPLQPGIASAGSPTEALEATGHKVRVC